MSIIKGSFHLHSSSIKIEDQDSPKQGIVSILGSETNKSASLRRTLSADMSSKKWLAQNGFGFSPMKKIASSEELTISNPAANHSSSSSFSTSSEGEEEYDHHQPRTDDKEELIKSAPGQDDVWRSIQQQQSQQKPDGKWTWSSILYDKNEQSSKLPPAYIHPLVRRSGSSLSEKSLEICTESLGSETGSDGFSSYPPSEAGDAEEEKENDQQQQQQTQQFAQQRLSESYDDSPVVKYNYSYSKKMGPRSFPPPLPSLAREDGAAVHMQSHRENGRLVLEAVSVPSQNYFHALREGGRLRLSFLNNPSPSGEEDDDEVEEFEQVFDNFEVMEGNDEANSTFDAQEEGGGFQEEEGEEEEDEEEEDEGMEAIEIEKGRRKMEEFVIKHVSTSTLMVKKLMGLDKKNLASWSSRFNNRGGVGVNLLEVAAAVVEEDEEGRDPTTNPPPLPLPQSLPPPTRVVRLIPATKAAVAAASFNAYEYFWREKPSMASIIKPVITADENKYSPNNNPILTGNLKGCEKQNLVLMRGNKAEYLVPFLRGCNESRRSQLLWEPYCIATS